MKRTGTHRSGGTRALVLGVATTVAALGLVGVAPSASAAVTGDWAYEISGDSATITAWAGNCNDHPDLWAGTPPCAVVPSGGTLTIPSTLGGKPVTGIGDGAVQASDANGGTAASSLVIPSTVTSIGAFALTNFSSATAPSVPSGLQSIGSYGLTGFGASVGHPLLVLPASLMHLGGEALGGVNVDASAALPHLTSVDASVFLRTYNHSLGTTAVTLTNILTIGPEAFKGTGIASLTLGSGLTDMYDWGGSGGTFRDNQISSIVIPGSLQSIPSYAFYNNPLSSIVVNSGITAIGDGAFSNPTATHSITTLSLPGTITSIGSNAFDGSLSSSVSSLTLPTALTTLGDYAFNQARLGSLTLNANLRTIGAHAFDHALSPGVTALTFPSGVTSIGDYAFANNNLENVTIPASVRTIGTSAFAKMGPQTITYISPVFSGLTPAAATVDTAYSTTFGASGASLAVKSGDSLPDGLTLDSSTGVLAGTPTTAGTYTFRLVATNADPASTTNASSPSNSSPYTSSPVTLTINGAAPSPGPSGDSGGSGASSPSATPTPTPTATGTASVTPTLAPSASATPSALPPAGVVLLSGAERASAQVVTVTAPVSTSVVTAPEVTVTTGTAVAPVVSGLPPSTPLQAGMSVSPLTRAKVSFVSIGTTRSTANGRAKVPAFKASRAGIYTIRLTTPAGKAFYLKVRVTPKKASGTSAR